MTHLSTESFVYSLPVIPQATREDFIRTARMLKERAGIVLGEHKEDMVARSLGLETKNLGVAEVRQYLDFLDHNPRAPEWERFVNTFTINHTAFFRESHHFVSLAEFVKKRSKPLSVWCAAASTGEEVYTIAMVLQENVSNAEISCNLLASDIDTQALVRAEEGVYSLDRVQPVEESLLRKYFQRGVGKRAGMVRVKPVLRNMVDFRMINLVSSENWPTDQSFDVVFCRNTMIYFEKETQSKLLDKFAQVMKPGALLFVGHSENISHLSKAFRLRGQTVYVRV